MIGVLRRAGAGLKETGQLPFEEAPTLDMPSRHALELRDVDPRRLESVLLTTYERAPQDFEMQDRATYDRTVDTLHRAMAYAKVDRSDKIDALKRRGRFAKCTEPCTDERAGLTTRP